MPSREKRLFLQYPSFIALASLMVGVWLARALTESGADHVYCTRLLVPFLGVTLFGACFGKVRTLFLAALVFVLFAVLGFHITRSQSMDLLENFPLNKARQAIEATIDWKLSSGVDKAGDREIPFKVFLVHSGVEMESGLSLPGKGRLRVTGYGHDLYPGDRISFRSAIRKPRNRGNPGEFDWELYCLTNNIRWLVSARGEDSIVVMDRANPWGLKRMIHSLRNSMTRFIEKVAQGDNRAILKGVALGDRGELSQDLIRNFAGSGLVHMLSASGLHVGMVAIMAIALVWMATWIFPSILLFTPKRKLIAILSIPLMVLYCLLVGTRTPMIRAVIMGVAIAAAILLDRPFAGRDFRSVMESFSLPAIAALMILLMNPNSLFTAGFQLSFMAVVGITLLIPRIIALDQTTYRESEAIFPDQRAQSPDYWTSMLRLSFFRFWGWFFKVFIISLSAQIILTPFLLWIFHRAPIYSVWANLIASPALAIALPLTLISSAISSLFPDLAYITVQPAIVLTDFITGIAKLFANLPYSSLGISSFSSFQFVASALLSITLLWIFARAGRSSIKVSAAIMAALIVCLAISGFTGSASDELEVTFLNVGRGDCALIRTPGGKSVLVDTGPKYPYFDAGESIALPFLRYVNVDNLEAVVISHMQSDHIGGLESVSKAASIGRFYYNPVRDRFKRDFPDNSRIIKADRSLAEFTIDRVRFRFLNLPGSRFSNQARPANLNNASCVLKIEYGSVGILFTGDIESETESALCPLGRELESTVLKVPHHGSNSSSAQRFLDKVRPKVAVISCSWPARGGLPAPDTIDRLKDTCEHVYWTGRDGAVVLRTNGERIRVSAYRVDEIEITP
jgi:competence protein ComEC